MEAFKSIAEAFNHYRTATLPEIERRAAEIRSIVDSDPKADMATFNIELQGLAQAKANTASKKEDAPTDEARAAYNTITGMDFGTQPKPATVAGDVLESREYRSAFYKTLLGQSLTEVERAAYDKALVEHRADAFSTSGNMAAVIPTETLNEIISKARTQGGLMSVCRGFNIPANVSVPVGTPSTAASWHTEGAKQDSEKPDIANVTFGGYEIMKVFSISAKVRRMTISAFESYLTTELDACVMATIAAALVSGTGTNQGTGLLTGVTWTPDTNSFTFSKTAGLTYADVVKVVAALKRGYAGGAAWAMNNATLYNLFYGMTDANKRPIFVADPKSESIGKILGFPVVVDDNFDNEDIVFGNFQYMSYNLPEGIAIEKSTESSFKNGLIDYRAMAIADTKPIVPEAFVKLARATS